MAEANLRSEGSADDIGRDRARVSRRLGRAVPFRLEPSDDSSVSQRLCLDGPLSGWVVLSFTADPLAPPLRPLLRVLTRSGEAQDAILPGPVLGRSHWIGLIPDDATTVLLSMGEGTSLERVGRRNALSIFGECLLRRPGNAFAALYARAKGQSRRARDILRGGVAVTKLRRYESWARSRFLSFDGPTPSLAVACVVFAGANEGEALRRTLAALSRQRFAPTYVRILWDGAPAFGDQANGHGRWEPSTDPVSLLGEADALCLFQAGDEPSPDSLTLLASALGTADMAYADSIGANGLPRLKPDWSPDLALATGYIGRPALMARKLIERLPRVGLGPFAQAASVLDIATAAACHHAVHVCRPLARLAGDGESNPRGPLLAAGLAAAASPAGVVERGGGIDLLWPLPEPAPLVSVVIPSRDRLDLISVACRGVLDATDYPALELIVVDNGSSEPSVLDFYEELKRDRRVRILPFPEPFNFAAMVNAGVGIATGDVVVLLNNDIAVRDGGWLREMVRQAVRPETGAVGAKLLFGDGTLQHAGVVLGLGGRSGHILRRRPADTPGHLGRLRVAHEVGAVTAACLAVSAAKYRAVGGFDAEAFPVDFNDVDFCLRLRAKGWKSVWTPAATLSHFESISRGPSVGAKRARFEAEAARFMQRWREVVRHDPYYHPALSLTTFGEDLE
ncbi:MAG: glycosyltransferase family 2 protein [Parafilimonas terrae]|nr:glycosyltransferase family 2 protein [Parafilimonas terrae]